jgi:hypothetical protein
MEKEKYEGGSMRVIMKIGSYNLLLKPESDIGQIVNMMDGAFSVDKTYHGKWEKKIYSEPEVEFVVVPDGGVDEMPDDIPVEEVEQTKEASND